MILRLRSPMVPAFALVAMFGAAQAQDGTVLDPILVTDPDEATDDSDPAVSTVGAAVLQGQYQGAALATVLNGLAGVTTQAADGDPAIAVNIRGLSGDGRTVVTIDGARQNFARSGHGASGTFYADPEMLREMTITRGASGPGAAAGAIGGTLALRTLTAADLIEAGETSGGEARLRYGSLTARPTVHLEWATDMSDRATALFAATSSEVGDYTAGDGTLVHAANESLSLLGKFTFAPVERQEVSLALSQIASDYRDGYISGILRDNHMVTQGTVLDYGIGGEGDAWTGKATLYYTGTAVDQQLLDDDLTADGLPRSYQTATTGLRVSADGDLPLGRFDNRLTLVLDGFGDRVTTDDPTSAGGSLTASGERLVWSVLAEDKLNLSETAAATFGLRYDAYRLSNDEGGVNGGQLSPSLTLSQDIDAFSLFATAAKAYRPPTLSEALVSGQHPEPADFYIRPNPDLLPERALSYEVGATVSADDLFLPADTLSAQVSAYRNDVRDYIGLVRKGGLFDGYYQYDNIDRVSVEGVELELAYDAGFAFGALTAQHTTGHDEVNDEVLSGIAPNRAVLTAGLRSADRLTEYGTRITSVSSREDDALSSGSWTTVDLFVSRELERGGTLGLALNNITDAGYTQYLNTQPSPGFNLTASLTLRF